MPRPLDWYEDSKTEIGGCVKRKEKHIGTEMSYADKSLSISQCKITG